MAKQPRPAGPRPEINGENPAKTGTGAGAGKTRFLTTGAGEGAVRH